MTAPLLLVLTDGRQHVGAFTDGRQHVGAFTDGRQHVGAFTLGALPEVTPGAVMVVAGRVPLATTTGLPRVFTAPSGGWAFGGSGNNGGALSFWAALSDETPVVHARYVPGPNVATPPTTYVLLDLIRATDSLGAYADVRMVKGGPAQVEPYPVPAVELEVPIGSPALGEAGELFTGVPSGLQVQFTATGGTGPFTWSVERNATGATVDQDGLYTAGATLGEDIVLVVDSAAVETRVTVGVPDDVIDIFVGDELRQLGVVRPSYAIRPFNGVAPYTVALTSTETGATITPGVEGVPRGRVVSFALSTPRTLVLDVDGQPLLDGNGDVQFVEPVQVDLTGWTFDAALWGQRGALLASDLAISAPDATSRQVTMPDPATVVLEVAVLAITATPPDGPALDLAVLLLSEV